MAKRKHKNNESRSVQILKNSLEYFYPNGEWIKIPDVGGFGKNMRFMVERKYDAQYSYNGNRACFEVKAMGNNNFYFTDVKDHQIDNLIKALKTGANCYIVINLYIAHEVDRFYFIDIDDFLHWRETKDNNTIKDIELENDFHVAFRLDAKRINNSKTKLINLEKTYIV